MKDAKFKLSSVNQGLNQQRLVASKQSYTSYHWRPRNQYSARFTHFFDIMRECVGKSKISVGKSILAPENRQIFSGACGPPTPCWRLRISFGAKCVAFEVGPLGTYC